MHQKKPEPEIQKKRNQAVWNNRKGIHKRLCLVFLLIQSPPPTPHCVLKQSFTQTFPSDQDVTAKLKSQLIFIRFSLIAIISCKTVIFEKHSFISLSLMSMVSHKKSYLVCVMNWQIFEYSSNLFLFFSKYKTETANRGQRQLLFLTMRFCQI